MREPKIEKGDLVRIATDPEMWVQPWRGLAQRRSKMLVRSVIERRGIRQACIQSARAKPDTRNYAWFDVSDLEPVED